MIERGRDISERGGDTKKILGGVRKSTLRGRTVEKLPRLNLHYIRKDTDEGVN